MRTCLYWRWSKSKYFVTSSFSVAVHINEDVDAILVNAVSRLAIARYLRQVYEVLSFPAYLGSAILPLIVLKVIYVERFTRYKSL